MMGRARVTPSIPIIVCATGPDARAVSRELETHLAATVPEHDFLVVCREPSKADLLLAHLSIGLCAEDAELVDSTPSSVRVRISRLRDEGYMIDAVHEPGRGYVYRLRSAPC